MKLSPTPPYLPFRMLYVVAMQYHGIVLKNTFLAVDWEGSRGYCAKTSTLIYKLLIHFKRYLKKDKNGPSICMLHLKEIEKSGLYMFPIYMEETDFRFYSLFFFFKYFQVSRKPWEIQRENWKQSCQLYKYRQYNVKHSIVGKLQIINIHQNIFCPSYDLKKLRSEGLR